MKERHRSGAEEELKNVPRYLLPGIASLVHFIAVRFFNCTQICNFMTFLLFFDNLSFNNVVFRGVNERSANLNCMFVRIVRSLISKEREVLLQKSSQQLTNYRNKFYELHLPKFSLLPKPNWRISHNWNSHFLCRSISRVSRFDHKTTHNFNELLSYIIMIAKSYINHFRWSFFDRTTIIKNEFENFAFILIGSIGEW